MTESEILFLRPHLRNECLGILRSFFSMRRAEAKTHPVANREISELDDQNEMPS